MNSPAKRTEDSLTKMQDSLLEQAHGIIDDHLHFADIDPEDEAPPQEWIDKLGEAKAMRRFRLAQWALLPEAKAPVGMKNAVKIANGMAKANAARGGGTQLNVSVMLVQQDGERPVLDVIDEDGRTS